MKIGVLVNPAAGRGNKAKEATAALREAWAGQELLFPPEGGEKLPYVKGLQRDVEALLQRGTELLVTLGGDGTASYAAEAQLRLQSRIPMLGIGLGTANVGPIVTFTAEEKLPPPEELQYESAGDVAAFCGGKRIAGGFNDVVVGNTFLATVNGRCLCADGQKLLKEELLIEGTPLNNVLLPTAVMEKNGKAAPFTLKTVSQIILSPLERDNFYGRAVTGILCYAPDSPYGAAVCLSARPLVAYTEDERGFTAFAPEEKLLLTAADRFTLRGLKQGVCLICDGNPYEPEGEEVLFRYLPDEVIVAKRR